MSGSYEDTEIVVESSPVVQVMEMLSDAVSQLILLVIALQEKNAEMPPQVPQASNAVAGAAGTLTGIAREMANEEYNEYPNLQKEILDASNEVDRSAEGLLKAVQAIRGEPDRRKGWEGLVNACKVIAGKTVRILQIVFGVELKRLVMAGDRIRDLMKGLNTQRAKDDPQGFADGVSEVASRGDELANFLRNRAQNEESPMRKRELEAQAKKLEDLSKDLIEACNDLLADPENPQKQKKFKDLMDQLEDEIKKAQEGAKQGLKDHDEDAAADLENMRLPEYRDPSVRKGGRGGAGAADDFDPIGDMPAPKPRAPVVNAVQQENKALGDLDNALIRDDDDDVKDAIDELKVTTPALVEKTKAAANQARDPAQKQALTNAANDLDELLKEVAPIREEIARNKDGDNAPARQRLAELAQRMHDDTDAIADLVGTPDERLDTAAKREKQALDNLDDAMNDTRGTDNNKVVPAIKALAKAQQNTANAGRDAVNDARDPPKRKNLTDALNDLDALLPQEVNAAKQQLQNPTPENKKRVNDVLDKMQADLDKIIDETDPYNRKPTGNAADTVPELAERIRKDARKVAENAGKGDLPSVQDEVRDENKAHAQIRNNVAKDPNLDEAPRAKALNKIDDLGDLIGQQEQAAVKVASNPNSKPFKDQLDNANKRINDKLNDIVNDLAPDLSRDIPREKEAINRVATAAKRGDPRGTEDGLRDADEILDNIGAKARSDADKANNPGLKKKVNDLLDDLDDLLDLEKDAARKVAKNPNDARAKKDLDDIGRKIFDDLDKLDRAVPRPPPRDPTVVMTLDPEVEREKDAIQEATRAANAGNKDALDDLLDEVAAAHNNTVKKALDDAKNIPNPAARKKVNDLLDDLDDLLGDQHDAAERLARNPADAKAKKDLNDINKKVFDDLDDLARTVDPYVPVTTPASKRSPDVHTIAPEVEREKELLEQIKDAIQKKDPPALANALREQKQVHDGLKEKANNDAAHIPDPQARKKIQDLLDDMDDLMNKERDAAVKAVRGDPKAAKDFDDIMAKLGDDLDQLNDFINPYAGDARAGPRGGSGDAEYDAEQEKDALDRLDDAVRKRDPKAVEEALQEIAAEVAPLINTSRDLIPEIRNPQARKKVQDAADDLENQTRRLPEPAAKVARNPNDARAKQELDEIQDRINDDIDTILANVPAPHTKRTGGGGNNDVEPEVRQAAKAVDKLRDAVKRGDVPAASEAARDVADAHRQLADTTRKAADKTNDPSKRKQIHDLADDVVETLPQRMAAVADALRNPNNKQAKDKADELLDGLKDLDNAITKAIRPAPTREAAAVANKVRRQLNDVDKALDNNDPHSARDAIEKVKNSIPEFNEQADGVGNEIRNPERRRKLDDDLRDLNKLLNDAVNDDARSAQNPNDQRAKDKAKQANKAAKKKLDDLLDSSGIRPLAEADKELADLERLAAAAKGGDPRRVADALRDVSDDQPEVVEKSCDHAVNIPDSDANQKIFDDIDALDKELPKTAAAAAEVVARPHDPRAKEKLNNQVEAAKDKIEKLKDDISNAPPALPYTNSDQDEAATDVNDLLPEIVKLTKQVAENPNDQGAQRKLDKLVQKIGQPLDDLLDSIDDVDPTDLADALANQGLDQIDQLKDAAKAGDVPQTNNIADQLANTHRELADAVHALPPDELDEEEKVQAEEAIRELNDIIPQLNEVAKQLAAAPPAAKPELKKKLEDLGNQAAKNFRIVKSAVKPPTPEAQLDRKFRKADGQQRRLLDALNNGNRNEALDALKNLRKTNRDIAKDLANAPPGFLDDERRKRIQDAIANLEKRLNPDKDDLVNRILSNPRGDPDAKKAFDDAKNAFQRAIDDGRQNSKAPLAKKISGEKDALKKLSNAAAKKDPPAIVKAIKDVAAKQGPVLEGARDELNKARDPRQRQKIQDAIGNLESQLPQTVNAGKNLIQNPENPRAQDDVQKEVKKTEKALADLEAAVNPTPKNDMAAAGKNEAVELAKLKEAAAAGDKRGVEDALKRLADGQKDFSDKAKKEIDKPATPAVAKDNVLDGLKDLDDLLKEVAPAARKVANNPNDRNALDDLDSLLKAMEEPIDKVIDNVNAPPTDTGAAAVAKVKAKIVAAALKPRGGNMRDNKDILRAAKDLSDLLGNMVGDVKDEAIKMRDNGLLTDRAKAILDLDELISGIEAQARNTAPANSNLDNVLDQLTQMGQNAARSAPKPAAAPLELLNKEVSKMTLEETLRFVAHDINQNMTRVAAVDQTTSRYGSAIASELDKLAQAIRSNNRQDMLVNGRALSATVLTFVNEIKKIAAACRDPVLQDKLIRLSQALRNMSTQLKILVSVKAAAGAGQDADADAQIASLTRNLGNMVNDSINTIQIVKSTKRA